MSERCRVVLVDDHAVVRAGVKLLIELTKRYEVIGEAENGEGAVERIATLQPDLVVMDIRMPGLDGIAATRRITSQNPDVRVLVFTAYDDPEYVEAVIEAGAMGCLSKRRARSDLVAALDMLASGRMTFPAHVTGLLAKRRSSVTRRPDVVASLTERERETLFLTAAGYTADEISRKIYLSPKTIANYRTALKNKLSARTRADLMRVVVESGHIADMLRSAGIVQGER
jgi:two-component system response regulator NreC